MLLESSRCIKWALPELPLPRYDDIKGYRLEMHDDQSDGAIEMTRRSTQWAVAGYEQSPV